MDQPSSRSRSRSYSYSRLILLLSAFFFGIIFASDARSPYAVLWGISGMLVVVSWIFGSEQESVTHPD
jgi:RNase P/RNase MRP subunit p30